MSLPDKIENKDGQLFKLVTKARHVFGAHERKPRKETESGAEQIERACTNCGLVRITVMRAPWRLYRHFNGAQFYDDVEPQCVSDVEVAIEARRA